MCPITQSAPTIVGEPSVSGRGPSTWKTLPSCTFERAPTSIRWMSPRSTQLYHTLACYRRPGQAWTFYEIDPEVLAYSTRGQFTFLDRCAPAAPVVIGDARLKLVDAAPGSFDILAVDAFSSDAIPLHLLTDEAVGVYLRALADDGLLLIHISNRFVDLEPVLSALARERGLAAAIRDDQDSSGLEAKGLRHSRWVVLARDRAKLAELTAGAGWKPLVSPATSVWRDDFASILPHLTWRKFF